MIYNRLTVNANQSDVTDSQRWREQTNSAWDYQLNPTPATIEDALRRGMKVAARVYDPFGDGLDKDNMFHLMHTPQAAADRFLAGWYTDYFAENVYWLYGWNEPVAESDEESMRGQLAWFIDFADRVPDAKLALGGWNISKTIHLEPAGNGLTQARFVSAGVWDKLLEYAHDNRDRILLDIHIYTPCRVWWNKRRRDGVPADSPAMKYAPDDGLTWQPIQNGLFAPQWHVGRSAPLIWRCRERGWDVRFGVGECIWDYMADVSDVLAPMERRWGLQEFQNDFRGIRSLRGYYEWLDMSDPPYVGFHELAYSDMFWLDEQLPPEFEYIAIFAGHNNPMWDAYNVFHPDMAPFLELIADHESDTESNGDNEMPDYVTPDTTDWMFTNRGVARHVDDGNTTNVRGAPTTAAPVVGTLDYTGLQADVSDKTVNPNDTPYDWKAVQLPTGAGIGWVALSVVRFYDPDDNPDDKPEPPPPDSEPRYNIDFPLPDATIEVSEDALELLQELTRLMTLIAQALETGTENARRIESDD